MIVWHIQERLFNLSYSSLLHWTTVTDAIDKKLELKGGVNLSVVTKALDDTKNNHVEEL